MADGSEETKENQSQCLETNKQCAVLRRAAKHRAQCAVSNLNWQEQLRGVMASGQLGSVLSEAFALLQDKIPKTAVGSKCTVKKLEVLREAAQLGTEVPAWSCRKLLVALSDLLALHRSCQSQWVSIPPSDS